MTSTLRQIQVDEDTLIWSTTGRVSSAKLALIESPNSIYLVTTGGDECQSGAAWYLSLGGPIVSAASESASAPSIPSPAPGQGVAPSVPASVPGFAGAPSAPLGVTPPFGAATAVPRLGRTSVTPVNRYAITPGVGVGAVRLGMNVVKDVVPMLGAWKYSVVNPDGTLFFRWYDFSTDTSGAHHGGGVNVLERSGAIAQLSVYHAPEYVVDGIATGATEEQVRAVLGAPLRVITTSALTKMLAYRGVEVWISEVPNDPDRDYDRVFQITVVPQ